MSNPWEGTRNCHICHESRPRDQVFVFIRDLSESLGLPAGTTKQHIQYCSDNAFCAAMASITVVLVPRTRYTHYLQGTGFEPVFPKESLKEAPNDGLQHTSSGQVSRRENENAQPAKVEQNR